MFVQIDEEVNQHVLIDKTTDYRFDEAAVKSQDALVDTSSGTKRRRQMMHGFSLCIKWCNRNTTWRALKDIKEAYPVQLAEYAIASKISMDPAFDCWVTHTLKKKNRIISKVISNY